MGIVIKKGRLIDPGQGIDKICDIYIRKGKVAEIRERIERKGVLTINAEGKIVMPGLVDMHTHLREPGNEEKETIETGVKAATKGGFTTVFAMPNTNPPCDNGAQARFVTKRAEEAKRTRVIPVGTLTKDRKGAEISEMSELKDAGVLAVSDDGDTVGDSGLMRKIMEYASMYDLLVISHCEDKYLAKDGVMHEGYWSTVLGLKPIPSEAETIIIERDIQLAELTGARLHIAHISTEDGVEKIRQAKKRGVKVTSEVTPHHLSLTDEDLKTFDRNLKVNPPLRTKEDVLALKKGLKDGTIDVIATDHAPHTIHEKEKEFDFAPFGMIGLETALSLIVQNVLDEGILDWTGIVEKMALNPCLITKLNRGSLREGMEADITVVDPKAEWCYAKEDVCSLSSNSPFIGKRMKAAVTDVFIGGRRILEDRRVK